MIHSIGIINYDINNKSSLSLQLRYVSEVNQFDYSIKIQISTCLTNFFQLLNLGDIHTSINCISNVKLLIPVQQFQTHIKKVLNTLRTGVRYIRTSISA